MSETTNFDRLRSWVEGSLDQARCHELEQELALDLELRRQADEFRAVWAATSASPFPIVASTTTFSDLVEREPEVARVGRVRAASSRSTSIPGWRRAAAAFMLLIPAAWWGISRFTSSASETVLLHAVQLDASANASSSAPAALIPSLLANYAPIENGKVRWIESLDDARAISKAMGRPVFVFGYWPGCPLCAIWNATTFVDPKVQADIEQFVPVAIDLSKLPEEEMKRLYEKRYPYLEFETIDGSEPYLFPGNMDKVDLPSELESGARALVSSTTALSWADARALAQSLTAANEALETGRMGTAEHEFALVLERSSGGTFKDAGLAGARRIALAAREVIESARLAARQDERAARARLASELARFEGTRFSEDLHAVYAAWMANGEFPELRQRAR